MAGFARFPTMTTDGIKRFWDNVDAAHAAKYAAKPQWEKRRDGGDIIEGWWTALRCVGRMR